MPTGSVSISSKTSMNGVLWASNICTPNGIDIYNSDIQGILTTWNLNGNITFGRTLTRGIRGTSMDKFRRW
jgi:hypothetical protein